MVKLMNNLIICEITGVLTERWMDSEDVEHICDFSYIESAIRNLKALVEETNSILVIADLERWATTDLYNETRISNLKKHGLNIGDCLKISLKWQENHLGTVNKDIGLSSLINKFISSKNYDVQRVAYIKQGEFDKKLNPIGDGIYTLSLFNKKGLTKECSQSIKHFLLNGYKLSDSFKFITAHKEETKLPYDLLILSEPYEHSYPRIYLKVNNEHYPILIDLNPQFLGREPALFGTEKAEIFNDVQHFYYTLIKHWKGKITDRYLLNRLTDVV